MTGGLSPGEGGRVALQSLLEANLLKSSVILPGGELRGRGAEAWLSIRKFLQEKTSLLQK